MADISKEKKLALARRMLKEYQKKEKDHPNKPKISVKKSESPKPDNESELKIEQTESVSLHDQGDQPTVQDASPNINSPPDGVQTNNDTQFFEVPQTCNFFDSTNNVEYNNAASFFDNMQHQYIFETVSQKTNELENVSNTEELSTHINGAENHTVFSHTPENNSSVNTLNGTSAQEFEENTKKLGPLSSSAQEFEENTKKLGPLSSSESLRQISMEVNDLLQSSIQESSDSGGGGTAISELEHRNQELVALLADEKQQTQQLQFQLQESKRREKELQDTIERVQAEVDARVVREVDPLQEQVRLYAETVGILVGEKTELQSALNRSQQLAKSKAAEVEELQGRLRTSKHRIFDLERDYASVSAARELHEQSMQEVTNELNKLKLEHTVTKRELEEAKEEKLELEQKVNLKTCEIAKLQKELQERISQLSLSQLTIQQLSSSDQPIVGEQVQALQQMNASLQRQLEQAVQTASSERDEFQLYVQQLNAQMASLTSQLEVVSDERDLLRQREDSATRHISELEKQLSDGPKLVAEDFHRLEAQLRTLKSANDDLSSKYDAQTAELENTRSEMEKLSALLEEARELKVEINEEEQLDRNALLAAMESDKLAAARAVSQNQTLKQQVNNLEDSLAALNNDKSLLQSDYEKALTQCKNLEEELAKSKETTRDILNEHNQQLMNLAHNNEIETLKLSLEQLQKDLQETRSHTDMLKAENAELKSQRTQQPVNNIDIEAMEKLQEKFTKTMAEVAELSEEKLRLEHLVLQLQDETETIGEYVSLYQNQRRLLRQRAEEKDKQLACLSKDREELKIKLNQLNKLIVKLIEDKGQDNSPPITNGEEKAVEVTPEIINGPTDTAGEIMNLITSIGSSSLVDSENFHPCPWCSGRLITV